MIPISVWCILLINVFNSGITSAYIWNYKSKDGWPRLCSEGKQQSPINLSPDIAEIANFPPFNFDGYDDIYSAYIKSNGHTVEVKLNVARRPTVKGGGLNVPYVLDAMHFHWDSEHTLDEKRFPLELHLVHYDNRSKDLSTALGQHRVAVFAVLFYLSPEDDTEFGSIFEAMEILQTKPVNINIPHPVQRLELDDFLPRDRAGYYRYMGSLTTPDCSEGVTWTVFTSILPISKRQLDIFKKFTTLDFQQLSSNYRPLQDLNDRRVLLKVSGPLNNAADCRTTSDMIKLSVLFIVLMFIY